MIRSTEDLAELLVISLRLAAPATNADEQVNGAIVTVMSGTQITSHFDVRTPERRRYRVVVLEEGGP